MNSLQAQLQEIAAEFVSEIMAAMQQASLADLAGQAQSVAPAMRPRSTPARKPPPVPVKGVRGRPAAPPKQETGKRHRATADEVKRYKDLALSTAKQMPAGFSKGELMKRAGGKVDMGRFLGLLVDEGVLTRKGERRSARYWVK